MAVVSSRPRKGRSEPHFSDSVMVYYYHRYTSRHRGKRWLTKPEKELFSRSATFTKIFKCSIYCCFCCLKGDAGIVDGTIVEKAIHCENSVIWRMLNSCSNGFKVCEALSNSSSTILNSYLLIVKFHLLQLIPPLN